MSPGEDEVRMGIFVQLDDTVLFWYFLHTLYMFRVFTSGVTLQIGAVDITTYGLVLRLVGCHVRLVLFIALCNEQD
jgi:hypothetical protein